MFDTMKIAGVIKQARIDKNMTQMNLADAMGVSYQAVSNWERGNSMPDISKLEALCSALDITVEQLLGMESSAAAAVNKVIHEEDLTVAELKEVAPAMEPEEVKVRVEAKRKSFLGIMEDLSEMLEDIPGLLKEQLGSAKNIHVKVKHTGKKKTRDLSDLAEMAPYLEQDYLTELVLEAAEHSLDGIGDLAEHLNEETLEALAEKARVEDLEELAEAACHMDDKALRVLGLRCAEAGEMDALEEIACHLSEQIWRAVVEKARAEDLEELSESACYMGEASLEALTLRCEAAGEWDAITEIGCYLSERTLEKLVDRLIEKQYDQEKLDAVEELYPYMPQTALQKLAQYLSGRRDLDAMEELAPYL